MYKLLVIVCLAISGAGYSQCKNSIKLGRVVSPANQQNGGSIEISVATTDSYICTLYTQTGNGNKKIQERRGSNSATIRFSELDRRAMYQVQFEFLSEDDKRCRTLQKSEIIFDVE